MSEEFLEQLTERFPNDQELGSAVRYYFKLLITREYAIAVIEELILAKNFQL
jgi:hypothetical protein